MSVTTPRSWRGRPSSSISFLDTVQEPDVNSAKHNDSKLNNQRRNDHNSSEDPETDRYSTDQE